MTGACKRAMSTIRKWMRDLCFRCCAIKAALKQQNADQLDAVAAFHFLTTRMENPGGFGELLRPVLLRREKRFTG